MSHEYWSWRDDQLKHPEGRAGGGEPCVVCGAPVPPNAHWKHRDRHVCSSQCNVKSNRRFNRRRQRGELEPPAERVDPHTERPPLVFGMTDEPPYAYGFLGQSPRAGDVVLRHGSTMLYTRVQITPEELQSVRRDLEGDPASEHHKLRYRIATRGIDCHHVESGSTLVSVVDDHGTLGRLIAAIIHPDGTRLHPWESFESRGRTWVWGWETIRDVDDNGEPYDWTAFFCVPHPMPDGWTGTIWTDAYRERSEQLKRISSHTARHARRLRLKGDDGRVERIDPLRVYERDGWMCQLCGEPIDREVSWPDLWSASLDHRVPLIAGGEHTSKNVHASHLLCNIRKGGRVA